MPMVAWRDLSDSFFILLLLLLLLFYLYLLIWKYCGYCYFAYIYLLILKSYLFHRTMQLLLQRNETNIRHGKYIIIVMQLPSRFIRTCIPSTIRLPFLYLYSFSLLSFFSVFFFFIFLLFIFFLLFLFLF